MSELRETCLPEVCVIQTGGSGQMCKAFTNELLMSEFVRFVKRVCIILSVTLLVMDVYMDQALCKP